MQDVWHPTGRITGVILHPLAQKGREARRHAGGRSTGTQSADHAQPRGNRLTQQRPLAINHGLLLKGYPDIRRITAQRFAEESGRRDSNHGEGLTLHNEGGTHYGSVATIDGLPGAMAEYGNGRSGWLVIVGSEHPPAKG